MKSTKNMIPTIFKTLHASDLVELENIYEDWDNYENDVIQLAGYVGQIVSTKMILKYLKNKK